VNHSSFSVGNGGHSLIRTRFGTLQMSVGKGTAAGNNAFALTYPSSKCQSRLSICPSWRCIIITSDGGGKGSGDADDGERAGAGTHPKGFDDGDAFMQKMRKKMMEKRQALEKSKSSTASSAADRKDGRGDDNDDAVDFEPEEEEEEEEEEKEKAGAKAQGGGAEGEGGTGWRAGDADDETDKEKTRRKAIKERAKEYEALREEMKAKHRAARVMTGEERAKYDAVR